MTGPWTSAVPSHHGERHGREARQAEGAGARGAEIDDTAADEGPTSDDAHHHRAAGALVRDLHHGAEGQRAVRGRHGVEPVRRAARGATAMPIHGGDAALEAGGLLAL